MRLHRFVLAALTLCVVALVWNALVHLVLLREANAAVEPLRRPDFEDRMALVDHLDELRNRIIVSLVALGIAFALCFWQDALMLEIANAPLPGDREPLTFGVAEPFTTTLTVAAYAALILCFPVLIYELYAFILPALTPAAAAGRAAGSVR